MCYFKNFYHVSTLGLAIKNVPTKIKLDTRKKRLNLSIPIQKKIIPIRFDFPKRMDYVKPFPYNTGTQLTARRTDRIAISISRVIKCADAL